MVAAAAAIVSAVGSVVVLVAAVLLCVKKRGSKHGAGAAGRRGGNTGNGKGGAEVEAMSGNETVDMLRNPLREERGDTVGAQWSVRKKAEAAPLRDPTSEESVSSFAAYGS
jgi:hypothetical protein